MAKNIEYYVALKNSMETTRAKYVGLWSLVAQILGLMNNLRFNQQTGGFSYNEMTTLDYQTYDPSVRRALDTVSDYYCSLVWPTHSPFFIEPPLSTDEKLITEEVRDWYLSQSQRITGALYHPESGFNEVKTPFYMDWESFGTSGFMVHENDNDLAPFIIQGFGVDNMAIQDGRNGLPEYALLVYNWNPQVIVDYFCPNGTQDENYMRIPEDIRKEYELGDWDSYHMVYCVLSRNPDYKKTAKLGNNSKPFVGAWFFETMDKLYKTDYFYENPLSVARFTRVRGEVYGRSDTSNFINTIVAINGIIYLAYKALSKQADPAVGIFDNALADNTEIDTDAGAVVALSATFPSQQNPIIPIQDVGNVQPITQFLLTYLKDELQKAYKLDVIADLIQTKQMTATEFVNRLAIRGEVLSGLITRHISQLQPFYTRIVGICQRREGFLDMEKAPDFVKKAIEAGRPWYNIRYNNMLENILNASKTRDFMNVLNMLQMAATVDESIKPDIDLYDTILEIVKNSVLINVLPTKTIHNERKAERAKLAAKQMEATINQGQSVANRNNALAARDNPDSPPAV